MKKILSIIMSLLLLATTMTGTATVAFAAEPEDNQWEVTVDGLELVSVENIDGGFSLMANGPILVDSPTGTMAGQAGKTVTDGAIFYLRVPEGTTLNRLYCIARNENGIISTIYVSGILGSTYIARSTGQWYRVSDNNLGVAGGTTLALTVSVLDKNNPYNIVIVGRK